MSRLFQEQLHVSLLTRKWRIKRFALTKIKNQKKFAGSYYHVLSEDASGNFDLKYLLWNILRHVSFDNQKVSSFSGWQVLVREITNVATEKTVMTYLTPVNGFSIIFGFLTYMQR